MRKLQGMPLRISHEMDVRLIDSIREYLPISAFDFSKDYLSSLTSSFHPSNPASHALLPESNVTA
jgi:hypothetical protein